MKDYLRLFSKIFWVALLLIILGFLIQTETVTINSGCKKYIDVFSEIMKTIGVALLVANIFSFIIGTKQFVDFINKKLRDIIISNDFVTELDSTGKEKLAKLILGPKAELSRIYSGIDNYFDRYLRDSFKLFTFIFRGRVTFDVKAKYDESNNVVFFDEHIEYRSFKVDNKIAKLRYNFEDERSEHLSTKITTPDGTDFELGADTEKDNPKEIDPSMKVRKIQEVPDEFTKYDYLDIERKFIEYGYDHWGILSYKASQPSDGFRVKLECYDGLKIRYINTYGERRNFDINEIGDTEVIITCKRWLTPGFGVAIIVSKE